MATTTPPNHPPGTWLEQIESELISALTGLEEAADSAIVKQAKLELPDSLTSPISFINNTLLTLEAFKLSALDQKELESLKVSLTRMLIVERAKDFLTLKDKLANLQTKILKLKQQDWQEHVAWRKRFAKALPEFVQLAKDPGFEGKEIDLENELFYTNEQPDRFELDVLETKRFKQILSLNPLNRFAPDSAELENYLESLKVYNRSHLAPEDYVDPETVLPKHNLRAYADQVHGLRQVLGFLYACIWEGHYNNLFTLQGAETTTIYEHKRTIIDNKYAGDELIKLALDWCDPLSAALAANYLLLNFALDLNRNATYYQPDVYKFNREWEYPELLGQDQEVLYFACKYQQILRAFPKPKITNPYQSHYDSLLAEGFDWEKIKAAGGRLYFDLYTHAPSTNVYNTVLMVYSTYHKQVIYRHVEQPFTTAQRHLSRVVQALKLPDFSFSVFNSTKPRPLEDLVYFEEIGLEYSVGTQDLTEYTSMLTERQMVEFVEFLQPMRDKVKKQTGYEMIVHEVFQQPLSLQNLQTATYEVAPAVHPKGLIPRKTQAPTAAASSAANNSPAGFEAGVEGSPLGNLEANSQASNNWVTSLFAVKSPTPELDTSLALSFGTLRAYPKETSYDLLWLASGNDFLIADGKFYLTSFKFQNSEDKGINLILNNFGRFSQRYYRTPKDALIHAQSYMLNLPIPHLVVIHNWFSRAQASRYIDVADNRYHQANAMYFWEQNFLRYLDAALSMADLIPTRNYLPMSKVLADFKEVYAVMQPDADNEMITLPRANQALLETQSQAQRDALPEKVRKKPIWLLEETYEDTAKEPFFMRELTPQERKARDAQKQKARAKAKAAAKAKAKARKKR